MGSNTPIGKRPFVVLGIAVLITVGVMLPLSGGDILINGSISMTQVYVPPNITIVPNYQPPGGTIVVTTTYTNNTTNSVIQVHVQFNSSAPITNPYLILNVLSLFNNNNLTGNFTMYITQSAKAGGSYLPSSYTTYLKVYIKHGVQTNKSLGTHINDKQTYTFEFYPYVNNSTPMYYMGFNYSKPPPPPPPTPPGTQIQQYINMTLVPIL